MPVAPQVHISESTDPYRNIATEEYLVDAVGPGRRLLYLWQNARTVVVGRNQNAWKECRVADLEADGGHLARRLSGGGAVYHDIGNLNFTFIAHDGGYDVAEHMDIICRAVRSFGLDARVSGRNDATIGGAKFSGNAFFRKGGRRCHHGTLMIGVDGEDLARYLQPDPKKLAAKGIDSVRSRVVNLSALEPRITVGTLTESLVDALAASGDAPVEPLDAARFDAEDIARRAARFASWEWRLGKASPFTHAFDERFPWGNLDVEFQVERGIIEDAHIASDALDADFILELAALLRGCRFDAAALEDRFRTLKASAPEHETMSSDLYELVRSQL